jgi:hypothetical protein
VASDLDDLLKGFIAVIDGLKRQMNDKVDRIVESYVGKFQQYNISVDSLLGRASDTLQKLEVENQTNALKMSTLDPLSRDIQLMKLKRENAIRSEEILTQVKTEIDSERLLEKFQQFKAILSSEQSIYDDKTAEKLYRQLVTDLDHDIKAKPILTNLSIVRDPFENRNLETEANSHSRYILNNIALCKLIQARVS